MRLGERKKAGSAVSSTLANEDCSLETGEEVKSRVVLEGGAVEEAASRSTPAQTHTSRRFMSTLLEFCSVESSSRSLRWQRKRRERRVGVGGDEGAEAGRPSCRRPAFRTVKGIWSLCLLVGGSRGRREGNAGMKEREKKTDERRLDRKSVV